MSFIKTSKQLYRQVEALEKETSDHEISMARGECETIADRALAISAMLEGTPENGNPLPAWVQSKITNACDYVTTVHDYLKYSPKINESFFIEETSFEKIFQMQKDGKTSEDIAKELKLNASLVKKVLGEETELKEFTDAQIALLKKEFDPLKNKQISTARANQLSNILNKLDDGSLEKLKNALIPFVSALAAVKTTQRKFRGVKITNVKVPGLEGMAEGVDMSKVTKYKMISIKGDQKIITIDRSDLEKYLKLGYVIHEPLTEEAELKPVPSLEDSAKKHKVDIEVLKKQLEKGIKVEKEHTKDEKTAEKIALAHIDERPDYYDQLAKVEKQPVKESHFAIGQHVIYHGPKNPITPIKAQIIGIATPQTGAYYQIKKDDGETTYAAPEQMKLDEACWTGYKQVGMKKKNGKEVPNCVPEETIKEQKRLYIESIAAVKNKAEKSGMPYSILKQVYDRGMAAWKGGHRPGATQVQWALARVNSFVTKSSGTWGGADSDLAKKVKGD